MHVFIPPTIAHLEADLHRFVDAMVHKLRKNAHKGRWEALDLRTCFELLRNEADELETAVQEGNHVEMLLESADVANFAMMIAAIAMEHANAQAQAQAFPATAPGSLRGRALVDSLPTPAGQSGSAQLLRERLRSSTVRRDRLAGTAGPDAPTRTDTRPGRASDGGHRVARKASSRGPGKARGSGNGKNAKPNAAAPQADGPAKRRVGAGNSSDRESRRRAG